VDLNNLKLLEPACFSVKQDMFYTLTWHQFSKARKFVSHFGCKISCIFFLFQPSPKNLFPP